MNIGVYTLNREVYIDPVRDKQGKSLKTSNFRVAHISKKKVVFGNSNLI